MFSFPFFLSTTTMKLIKIIKNIIEFLYCTIKVYAFVYALIFLFKGFFVDIYYILNYFACVVLLIINDLVWNKYEDT